jgi:hypothetical protein
MHQRAINIHHPLPLPSFTFKNKTKTMKYTCLAIALLSTGTSAFTVPTTAASSQAQKQCQCPSRLSPLFMGRAAAVRAATKGKTDAKKGEIKMIFLLDGSFCFVIFSALTMS